ncbi:MAG: hypothetical protein PVI90_00535 [Desulfobacteraceae bacterium]|jgi:hypothetical protein
MSICPICGVLEVTLLTKKLFEAKYLGEKQRVQCPPRVLTKAIRKTWYDKYISNKTTVRDTKTVVWNYTQVVVKDCGPPQQRYIAPKYLTKYLTDNDTFYALPVCLCDKCIKRLQKRINTVEIETIDEELRKMCT